LLQEWKRLARALEETSFEYHAARRSGNESAAAAADTARAQLADQIKPIYYKSRDMLTELARVNEDIGASEVVAATVAATRAKVAETAGSTDGPFDGDPAPTPRAARAVGRAHRLSHADRSEEVRARHLLLGLLDVEGTGGQVLRGIGVDVARLRASLEAGAASAAEPDPAPVTAAPIDAVGPRCSGCGAAVDELAFANVPATDADGRSGDVVVFSCRSCGTILGVTPRRQGRD
jgi:hypothetical protein